jgi:hypothetical protein
MSQDALDLLLSGVKDEGQRKQIISAYYAFASGDPETFAVQFAVLLRAHALSLKALPTRFQKVIATETNRITELVLAHQNSLRTAKEPQNADRLRESLEVIKESQAEIQRELGICGELLKAQQSKIDSTVAAKDRILKRLAANRIVLALAISYSVGILSVLFAQRLLPLLLPCFISSGPRL